MYVCLPSFHPNALFGLNKCGQMKDGKCWDALDAYVPSVNCTLWVTEYKNYEKAKPIL
jgi:hypothetical protein